MSHEVNEYRAQIEKMAKEIVELQAQVRDEQALNVLQRAQVKRLFDVIHYLVRTLAEAPKDPA